MSPVRDERAWLWCRTFSFAPRGSSLFSPWPTVETVGYFRSSLPGLCNPPAKRDTCLRERSASASGCTGRRGRSVRLGKQLPGRGKNSARTMFSPHWLGELRRGYGQKTADDSRLFI